VARTSARAKAGGRSARIRARTVESWIVKGGTARGRTGPVRMRGLELYEMASKAEPVEDTDCFGCVNFPSFTQSTCYQFSSCYQKHTHELSTFFLADFTFTLHLICDMYFRRVVLPFSFFFHYQSRLFLCKNAVLHFDFFYCETATAKVIVYTTF
jgi:hypothetical protein